MHDKVTILNLNLARKDTFLIWVLGKIGVQGIPDTIHKSWGRHGWFDAQNSCNGIKPGNLISKHKPSMCCNVDGEEESEEREMRTCQGNSETWDNNKTLC